MSITFVLRVVYEAVILTVVLVLSVAVTAAQVRSSPNYQIQSDSINAGGGLGASANYTLEDSVGEIATGESTSTAYALRAGYQQMQEVSLSLTPPSNVVMDTTIPGITGGVANGSTTVTVVTDSPAGYALSIVAQTAPALRKGIDSIPDLGPAVQLQYATSSGQVRFGFSPVGNDVVPAFRNNTVVCGAGTSVALLCWRGLSTSTIAIAQGTGANQPNGATTTLQFRVVHGGGVVVAAGAYVATTTLTALPL